MITESRSTLIEYPSEPSGSGAMKVSNRRTMALRGVVSRFAGNAIGTGFWALTTGRVNPVDGLRTDVSAAIAGCIIGDVESATMLVPAVMVNGIPLRCVTSIGAGMTATAGRSVRGRAVVAAGGRRVQDARMTRVAADARRAEGDIG